MLSVSIYTRKGFRVLLHAQVLKFWLCQSCQAAANFQSGSTRRIPHLMHLGIRRSCSWPSEAFSLLVSRSELAVTLHQTTAAAATSLAELTASAITLDFVSMPYTCAKNESEDALEPASEAEEKAIAIAGRMTKHVTCIAFLAPLLQAVAGARVEDARAEEASETSSRLGARAQG